MMFFFFSSRRRHTRFDCDWSSDVCSSDLLQIDRLSPFQPRGTDVAVILDLMIHDLDLVLELVRAPVTDVRATGVAILTPHVDIVNARIEFANGAIANVTASRVSRERTRKLRIFQPTGYCSLDLAQGSGDFFRLQRGRRGPVVAKRVGTA